MLNPSGEFEPYTSLDYGDLDNDIEDAFIALGVIDSPLPKSFMEMTEEEFEEFQLRGK